MGGVDLTPKSTDNRRGKMKQKTNKIINHKKVKILVFQV